MSGNGCRGYTHQGYGDVGNYVGYRYAKYLSVHKKGALLQGAKLTKIGVIYPFAPL